MEPEREVAGDYERKRSYSYGYVEKITGITGNRETSHNGFLSSQNKNNLTEALDYLEVEKALSRPEEPGDIGHPAMAKHHEGEPKRDELCFICMGKFTSRNPATRIPCVERCNNAPIHAKCIYEWGERQKTASSCPLCRSKLLEIDYTPPDLLKSHQLVMFGCRKAFITLPIPRKAGMVRCFIIAERKSKHGIRNTMWRLYLQEPPKLRYPSGPRPDAESPRPKDRLLLVARKRGRIGSRIDITLDESGKNFRRRDVQYVGSVVSSALGLEHTLIAPLRETSGARKPVQKAYLQLGFVKYTQNRVGRAVGPRRMKIALPSVSRPSTRENGTPYTYHDVINHHPSNWEDMEDSDDELGCEIQGSDETRKWTTRVHRPANRTQTLRGLLRKGHNAMHEDKNVILASNVEPYWLEQIGAYSLDFQGRVTLPSNKNFQLVAENRSNDVILQFGKVMEQKVREIYTMDLQWPLSPLQAFGICLSACDRKLACA